MKCTVGFETELTRFSYEEESDDVALAGRARMSHESFVVYKNLARLHPDLVALIAIFGVKPWIGDNLTCNVASTRRFAEAVNNGLGFRLSNVDEDLEPRRAPVDGRVGLAYSGGADCTAAAALLEGHVNAYFLDRVTRPGETWRGVYRKDAAHHSIAEMAGHLEIVRSVQTDLEFIREPVGFPDDLSNIIPALCFADEDQLDGVAWGTILESTYRIGAKKYRDYARSPFIAQYGPAFAAAGLGMVNAVAGVSEVGTAIINERSGYASFAQSCMRGEVGQPCRNCWKCARKIMLDSALSNEWPPVQELDLLLANREASMRFLEDPIKHEIVVAFSVGRYSGGLDHDSMIMGALHERLASHEVEFLQKHYGPALDLLPEKYQAIVRDRVNGYLDKMDEGEERALRAWSIAPHLESARRIGSIERLELAFKRNAEG